jgi:hypothetical protein
VTVDKSRKYYAAGFKIGYRDIAPSNGKSRYYINNHLTIVIRYRKAPGRDGTRGGKVVVGFEVYTKSIGATKGQGDGCPADVNDVDQPFELYMPPNSTTDFTLQFPHSSYYPPESELDIDDGATMDIPYTYSVYWREDEKIDWHHRWDLYFVNQEEGSRIHWLAIINSLVISGLLSAIVAMILARTIRGDIKMYKDATLEDGKIKIKRRSRPGSGARTPKSGEKGAGILDQVGDTENDADVSSDEEISCTSLRISSGPLDWLRDAVGFHGFWTSLPLQFGCPESLIPGWIRFRWCWIIYFRRPFLGLLLRSSLQNFQRSKLAKEHYHYGASLSGTFVFSGVRPQPLRVVSGILYSSPIQYPHCNNSTVALHPIAIGVRRKLVWICSDRSMGAPNKDDHNSSTSPSSSMVYPVTGSDPPCGPNTLCCHIHRTPLRFPVALARQIRLLLRFWIPLCCLNNPNTHYCRSHHCHNLHQVVL